MLVLLTAAVALLLIAYLAPLVVAAVRIWRTRQTKVGQFAPIDEDALTDLEARQIAAARDEALPLDFKYLDATRYDFGAEIATTFRFVDPTGEIQASRVLGLATGSANFTPRWVVSSLTTGHEVVQSTSEASPGRPLAELISDHRSRLSELDGGRAQRWADVDANERVERTCRDGLERQVRLGWLWHDPQEEAFRPTLIGAIRMIFFGWRELRKRR